MTAISTVPADTYALPDRPSTHAVAKGIDYSGDLMSRNSWIFNAGEETFFLCSNRYGIRRRPEP